MYSILPARREKPRGLSLFYKEGLNFKLDVGTLRLDQQVACQRHRQHLVIAKITDRAVAYVRNAAQTAALAFAPRATVLA